MLSSAVLCCAVLCCAVLCYAVPCCAVLRCAKTCCAALSCSFCSMLSLCVPHLDSSRFHHNQFDQPIYISCFRTHQGSQQTTGSILRRLSLHVHAAGQHHAASPMLCLVPHLDVSWCLQAVGHHHGFFKLQVVIMASSNCRSSSQFLQTAGHHHVHFRLQVNIFLQSAGHHHALFNLQVIITLSSNCRSSSCCRPM